MKKHATGRPADRDLEIPELGANFFKNAEVGRYYSKVMAKSNVVRIASDVMEAFPNEEIVNAALRELLRIRESLQQFGVAKPKRKKTA